MILSSINADKAVAFYPEDSARVFQKSKFTFPETEGGVSRRVHCTGSHHRFIAFIIYIAKRVIGTR